MAKTTTTTSITIPIDLYFQIQNFANEQKIKFSTAIAQLCEASLGFERPKVEDQDLSKVEAKITEQNIAIAQLKEQREALKQEKQKQEQKKLKKPYLISLRDEQLAKGIKEQEKRPQIKFTAKDRKEAKKLLKEEQKKDAGKSKKKRVV